jgi:hypothetical protein
MRLHLQFQRPRPANPEQFTLVEPPTPAPSPMQRYRYNYIGTKGANFSRAPLRPCLTDSLRQSLTSGMLHAKHKVTQETRIGSQSSGLLERESFASTLRAAIRQVGMRTDRAAAPWTRRMGIFHDLLQTIGAEIVYIRRQKPVAAKANARQY